MRRALIWWSVIGVLVVFAAGMATGMFIGARKAQDALVFKHRKHMGDRMRQHLIRELELTPEQIEKVSPIIDDTSRRLQEIRQESGRRVHDTMRESRAAIDPHLTPGQRERFAAMKHRQKRSMRHRDGPPHDGDAEPHPRDEH
jgi:Spy/CpxP family protein refolding chaperone